MKLKEAKKLAKKLGYKWICVDASDLILASRSKIHGKTVETAFGPYLDWSHHDDIIGHYTGSKWWTTTLREVD